MIGLDRRRRFRLSLAVFLLVPPIFSLCGWMLNSWFAVSRNTVELRDLSEQLLSRIEFAVDYAILTLVDLSAKGATDCTADSLTQLRQSIALRGAVKNIIIIGEHDAYLCSGLPVAQQAEAHSPPSDFSALNSSYILRKQKSDPDGEFEVVWRVDAQRSLSVVVSVDMIMFDVFPSQLRENSRSVLLLGKTVPVARYPVKEVNQVTSAELVFPSNSIRFPLAVQLTVDQDDVALWNNGYDKIAILGSGLLGVLFSILIGRLISRPPSEVEALRSAIGRSEIVPFFQPIFSLKDQKVVGCEVLMRWLRENQTVAQPSRFIPIAEESGLIFEMTYAVIIASLSVLKPIVSEKTHFKIAFNITPSHFASLSFSHHLREIVDAAGIDPTHVVLEITERQEAINIEESRRGIEKARNAGFRISLDDVGSGHNGLSNIKDLPIDIIKIDKRFVDLVQSDDIALAIVRMLVDLASRLHATTVAEGIETEGQLEVLRACGVDEGQGYLVGRPMPVSDFLAFMTTSGSES